MTTVPLGAQISCVERELRFRRRVYARRVEQGQMTRQKADQEIRDMEAVLETVKAAAAAERLL